MQNRMGTSQPQALETLVSSALQGNKESLFRLAYLYEEHQQYPNALQFYSLAAQQGHTGAIEKLKLLSERNISEAKQLDSLCHSVAPQIEVSKQSDFTFSSSPSSSSSSDSTIFSNSHPSSSFSSNLLSSSNHLYIEENKENSSTSGSAGSLYLSLSDSIPTPMLPEKEELKGQEKEILKEPIRRGPIKRKVPLTYSVSQTSLSLEMPPELNKPMQGAGWPLLQIQKKAGGAPPLQTQILENQVTVAPSQYTNTTSFQKIQGWLGSSYQSQIAGPSQNVNSGKKILTAADFPSNGIGMFPCPICEKEFPMRFRLNRHLKTHRGEKPHKCNQCASSFLEKSAWRRHQLVHTGDKPFGCTEDKCGKRFADKVNLDKHRANVHHIC